MTTIEERVRASLTERGFEVVDNPKVSDREEWLRVRRERGLIGSSDVPVILQCSKYKTPRQLAEEMLGMHEPDTSDNEVTRFGHAIEAVNISEWSLAHGEPAEQVSFTVHNGWLSDSPDGVAIINGELVNIESKAGNTADLGDWIRWQKGLKPAGKKVGAYYIQAQVHKLFFDRVFMVARINNLLTMFEVKQDDEIRRAIEWECKIFHDHVSFGELPPPIRGVDDIAPDMNDIVDEVIDMSFLDDVFEEYENACRDEKDAAKRKAKLSNIIKYEMKGRKRGLSSNHSVSACAGRSSFDSKAFYADHPEVKTLMGKYRKQGRPYYRISKRRGK